MIRNLGKLLGELETITKSLDARIADIHAFGGDGDCVAVVCRSTDQEVDAWFESSGVNPVEFMLELERRCSGKWIHYNLCSYPWVCDAADDWDRLHTPRWHEFDAP